MAEFPALPLFTDAYLGDTTHLTTIEHGAYLLLLMTAWRSRDCRLPNDDRLLARYTKLTASQWQRVKPIIEPFFVVSDDGWTQRRLTDEYSHVRQVRDSQAANGRASALKRKGRHATTVEPSVSQASTPSPSPTPTIVSEAKASSVKRAQPHPFPCPAEVDPQHWDDFMAVRRKKKSTNSLTAYVAILKDLQAFATSEWPPGRLVERSAAKNWAIIVDPNEHKMDNRNGNRPANDQPASPASAIAAARNRLGLDGQFGAG